MPLRVLGAVMRLAAAARRFLKKEKNMNMRDDQDFGGDVKQGTLISACEERQTREVKAVEAPCPLCGKIQEYFTDELRTKEQLRCGDCQQLFDAELFKKAAGL